MLTNPLKSYLSSVNAARTTPWKGRFKRGLGDSDSKKKIRKAQTLKNHFGDIGSKETEKLEGRCQQEVRSLRLQPL